MTEEPHIDNLPPDVERDLQRCLNVLRYLGLSELRLMALLDVIVRRWKRGLKLAFLSSDRLC